MSTNTDFEPVSPPDIEEALRVVTNAASQYAIHLEDTAGMAPYEGSDTHNLAEAARIRQAVNIVRGV